MSENLPLGDFIITDHAAFEMQRRGISQEMIREVLENPGQRITVREGREVFQNRLDSGGKTFLLRIIVDADRNPAEVVTAYKTSKIEKYWRH